MRANWMAIWWATMLMNYVPKTKLGDSISSIVAGVVVGGIVLTVIMGLLTNFLG